MFRVENVIEVQILATHFKHRARIRQNVALFPLRQNDRQSGGLASHASHARKIDATFAKAFQANLSQWIAADGRAETYFVSHRRQIVSKNRRGTSERNIQTRAQMFALQREFRR